VPSTATIQGSYEGLQEPQSITLQVAPWGLNSETFTMTGSLSAETQDANTYTGNLALTGTVGPYQGNYPFQILGVPQTSGGCVGISSFTLTMLGYDNTATYTQQ
jgi:hypothetical protein